MLGVFAQFENEQRRERQLEGIAKEESVYKSRKQSYDHEHVRQLKAEGLGVAEIMRQIKISKTHIYRILTVQ
ncbi:hypothetical protein AA11825_2611 [Acetobacter pomorum DSM 11825]|uniref:helix-turn-helix domain-containing protein n=1 Tax=Acetobacter pomorum TaxID=65959 RepID=UPI00181246CC|nr:hypothetical protein AA11825_2611 [Acetobacter pomorum DSM 11825]